MSRRVALGALALVLLLLAIAQLILPGIAAQYLRDRLQNSGQVLAVSVSAFPAIELLWHQADRVVVRLGRYRSSAGHLGTLLDEAGDTESLTAHAAELDAGLLTLRDATLRKVGSELTATAQVTQADIRAALPVLTQVTPVASGGGRLTVRATASVFGVAASLDATVSAHDGALVVAPDLPLGGLATITIFSNPHLDVRSVGATPTGSGFSVRATARLR